MRKIFFGGRCFIVLTSFYNFTYTIAKDCKENIVAVADAYNINVVQVLHLDNSSLKDLFWEHFVEAVKPWITCIVLVYFYVYFNVYFVYFM